MYMYMYVHVCICVIIPTSPPNVRIINSDVMLMSNLLLCTVGIMDHSPFMLTFAAGNKM